MIEKSHQRHTDDENRQGHVGCQWQSPLQRRGIGTQPGNPIAHRQGAVFPAPGETQFQGSPLSPSQSWRPPSDQPKIPRRGRAPLLKRMLTREQLVRQAGECIEIVARIGALSFQQLAAGVCRCHRA
jgi:hypothetical protein